MTGQNKAKPTHPDRLRAIGTLASARLTMSVRGMTFGKTMMRVRRQAETTLGQSTTHALRFKGLPAWVRGLDRFKQWVHAKLLINAAYQHATKQSACFSGVVIPEKHRFDPARVHPADLAGATSTTL